MYNWKPWRGTATASTEASAAPLIPNRANMDNTGSTLLYFELISFSIGTSDVTVELESERMFVLRKGLNTSVSWMLLLLLRVNLDRWITLAFGCKKYANELLRNVNRITLESSIWTQAIEVDDCSSRRHSRWARAEVIRTYRWDCCKCTLILRRLVALLTHNHNCCKKT